MRVFLKTSFAVMLCALPLWAGAHASPVEYLPEPSAVLSVMPEEVSVRFSERVDPDASFLRVEGPGGLVSQKGVVGEDPRVLVAPVAGGEDSYTVKWGVVSLDDGHFTRGEYSFAVGAPAAQTAPTFELITLTAQAEAVAMTFELLGNGMLWALLLLFALAVRPLLAAAKAEQPLLWRGYWWFGWSGIGLALVGQALQFFIKAHDLSVLQEIPFGNGFAVYFATAAGSATAWRAAAIAVFAAIFYRWGRDIFALERVALPEFALAGALCVFAYFRAVISHATANPFYPELSLFVNFVHLIEKDVWAGIALALLLLSLVPRLQSVLRGVLPRASQILAINLGLVAATGGYIVWLHLEEAVNLLSTAWGEAFLPLGVAAVLLLGVRAYSVFFGYAPWALAAESVLALLVIYRSSVVILTSPPLHGERNFDLFALVITGIVVATVALAAILYRAARRAQFYQYRGAYRWLWGALGAAAAAALLVALLPFFGLHNSFKKGCLADGNMWHFMPPSRAGTAVGGESQEGCMWGMGAYPYHFAERTEYDHYRSLGEATVDFVRRGDELTFTLTNAAGEPAELFVDMEKRLHIIVVSRDQSVFAHIHPDAEPAPSVFTARYAFPKNGEYLVSVDYAHGARQYAKQFVVTVNDGVGAQGALREYPQAGSFGGYDVSLEYGYLEAGEVATFFYDIRKEGELAELQPYLAAAMHVSAVKEDLSAFVHAHGEVHDPETLQPPVLVVDGRVAHSHLPVPPVFNSPVDAHLIFPSAGRYTVWGEFMVNGEVVASAFTVRVE
jgi:methionine-rich copper-binding protein CopC